MGTQETEFHISIDKSNYETSREGRPIRWLGGRDGA